MKKILLCGSVLALAVVGCTDSEFDSASGQGNINGKGISFEVVVDQTVSTRSGFTLSPDKKKHNFFWHAEADKIAIYSTYTTTTDETGGDYCCSTGTGKWSPRPAFYKASQSQGRGAFTGVDENNILYFGKTKEEIDAPGGEAFASQFLTVYPRDFMTAVADDETLGKEKFTFAFSHDYRMDDQIQRHADGSGVVENLFMYSISKASIENYYDAVGSKLDLKFVRPLTVAAFRTENYRKEYGALKEIKVTAKGSDNPQIAPSKLTIGNGHSGEEATYKLDIENPANNVLTLATGNNGTPPSEEIVLTVGEEYEGDGLEWSDDYRAYMAMSNISREAFRAAGTKEMLEVVYTFEHIEITQKVETAGDWNGGDVTIPENLITPFPALDFNDYDLITGGTSPGQENRLLVVNKNFSEIFNNGEMSLNNETIDLKEFSTIIANVELAPGEIEMLQEFNDLVTLELNGNTEFSLPTATTRGASSRTSTGGASLFGENSEYLQSLTNIILKDVTSIAEGSLAGNGFETVIMPKYKFDGKMAGEILNPKTLVTLDMSGVESMLSGGFNLAGYEKLKTVIVREGLKVGENAFSGCIALESLSAAVDITSGSSAFQNTPELRSIALTKVEIPAYAFNKSGIVTITNGNGGAFLPTSIGAFAFKDAKNLVEIDLSNATTLGESSFEGATALVGTMIDGRYVLRVGARDIPNRAFAGATSLVNVLFTGAIFFGNEVFDMGGATSYALVEINFKEPLSTMNYDVAIYSANTFGNTPSQTTLFVNEYQFAINGLVLTLNHQTATPTEFRFKSVRKNEKTY